MQAPARKDARERCDLHACHSDLGEEHGAEPAHAQARDDAEAIHLRQQRARLVQSVIVPCVMGCGASPLRRKHRTHRVRAVRGQRQQLLAPLAHLLERRGTGLRQGGRAQRRGLGQRWLTLRGSERLWGARSFEQTEEEPALANAQVLHWHLRGLRPRGRGRRAARELGQREDGCPSRVHIAVRHAALAGEERVRALRRELAQQLHGAAARALSQGLLVAVRHPRGMMTLVGASGLMGR